MAEEVYGAGGCVCAGFPVQSVGRKRCSGGTIRVAYLGIVLEDVTNWAPGEPGQRVQMRVSKGAR